MSESDTDRLDWIFSTDGEAALRARYDEWAATYDDDHDEWGWQGPTLVAEAVLRLAGDGLGDGAILDAGCGTGRAGVALRSAGFRGHLIGLDLSEGMLDVARNLGVYDELVQGSLLETPFDDDHVGGVVSSGVFTHGHVGGEAFAELCRITRANGVITVTQRVDLAEVFRPHDEQLTADGRWQPIERTEPENLHLDRGNSAQSVVSWRVR